MEIFDFPNKESLTKQQTEQVQQQQREEHLIGRERKVPGHTMFSYNLLTGEIKKAPVKLSQTVTFQGTPLQRPKIVIEPNCIYRQALNKKNFIKRLKREKYIK